MKSIKSIGSLTGAAILLAGVGLISSPASAIPEYGPQSNAYAAKDTSFTGVTTNPEKDSQGGQENGTMYGAYIPGSGPLNGKRVFCIDSGLAQPDGDGYDNAGKKDVKSPELSYILAKWDKERGDQVEQIAYDMAISEHVHRSDDLPHRDLLKPRSLKEVTEGIGWNKESKNLQAVGESKFKNDVLPQAYEASEKMTEESEKYAGDGTYEAQVKINPDDSTASISLVNSEGEDVPGFSGKITADGAEVSKTDIVSGTKPTVVDLDFTEKVADASVNVEFTGLPTGSLTLWQPKEFSSSDYDRYSLQQVVEGQTTSTKAEDSYEGKYSIDVSSQASINKDNQLPAEVTDTVRLENCHPGSTIKDAKVTAYREDEEIRQSEGIPEGAEKLKVFKQDVKCDENGKAKFTTDPLKLDKDFVQPGEKAYITFVASAQDSGRNLAWSHDYGIPSETVSISIEEEGKKVKTGAYVAEGSDSTGERAVGVGVGALGAGIALGAATMLLRRKNSNN